MGAIFNLYTVKTSSPDSFRTKIAVAADRFQNDRKLQKKLLLTILLLGFLIRIWICFFAALPVLHRDTYEYVNQANAILSGSYVNFFPNGYPFLIAFVKSFFGDNLYTVLLLLNVVFSTSIIFFVYDLSSRIFKVSLIALLTALLFAVFPNQVNYVRWLITEVPATFFLVGGYFFYFRRKMLAGGLFLGLATVIRTEVLFIFVLILLFQLVMGRKLNIRFLLSGLLPVVLVGGYCYSKTGSFSLAGHGKTNVLISVTASGNNIDWGIADKYPEVTTSRQAIQLYLASIKEDPGKYIKRRFTNFWELWGFYPSSAEANRGVMSRIVIGGGNLFLIVFGSMAWWRNRKKKEVTLLVLPFIVVTCLHVFLFSMPRYTYLVEPFLMVLALSFFSSFIQENRNDNKMPG